MPNFLPNNIKFYNSSQNAQGGGGVAGGQYPVASEKISMNNNRQAKCGVWSFKERSYKIQIHRSFDIANC